jgi:phosphomannomutase/phosphoglucomutase
VIGVDGARVLFSHGWGLLRASNTQPVLVMRFEADSQERLDAYRTEMESVLHQVQSMASR